ncbi:hypothetical protein AB0F17_35410 [Nonomuraea sp. NPDC026600]|uniref:hypothetical protein n=1 Tax=Nonomuraea sp. NPDC026600 TaxID=3155363 RepID=UPI0033E7BEDA
MYPSRIRWAEVVEQARLVIIAYEGGVTLRQCFYRLAVAGAIPNTAAAYRKLSAHLAQARRLGGFPDLIDAVREIHAPLAYTDPGEILAQVPNLYRRDRTEHQPVTLVLAAEKDTLRAQITSWTFEYGLPVLVLRGFSSETYVRRVRERLAADPRPAVLAYVGDHDASGEAILTDWLARTSGCWSSVERIALTHEQVLAYALPAAPGKAGDPRWPAFAARHDLDPVAPAQWEAEALDPAELRRLIEATIARWIDQQAWQQAIDDERHDIELLRQFVRSWPHPR